MSMPISVEIPEAHPNDESYVKAECNDCGQELDWHATLEELVPFQEIEEVVHSGLEHEAETGHSVTLYLYERE